MKPKERPDVEAAPVETEEAPGEEAEEITAVEAAPVETEASETEMVADKAADKVANKAVDKAVVDFLVKFSPHLRIWYLLDRSTYKRAWSMRVAGIYIIIYYSSLV